MFSKQQNCKDKNQQLKVKVQTDVFYVTPSLSLAANTLN